MRYWVYDAYETQSYTKIHWAPQLGLPGCYRGGPEENWHGPFATKAEAESKAISLMRIESGDCDVCKTREKWLAKSVLQYAYDSYVEGGFVSYISLETDIIASLGEISACVRRCVEQGYLEGAGHHMTVNGEWMPTSGRITEAGSRLLTQFTESKYRVFVYKAGTAKVHAEWCLQFQNRHERTDELGTWLCGVYRTEDLALYAGSQHTQYDVLRCQDCLR